MNIFVRSAAFFLAALAILPVGAQQPAAIPDVPFNPYMYNVKDFGAKGDGKADDTDAIQAAINAAVDNTKGKGANYHVFLPVGKYRITKSIMLESFSNSLFIQGAGDTALVNPAPTRIIWDGPEDGVMLHSMAGFGVHLADIQFDGARKAAICIAVDSRAGTPSDDWYVERVWMCNAKVGFKCSHITHSNCAADMTFIDVVFYKLGTGFLTTDHQNVNFAFIRPVLGSIGTGLHFQRGGTATINMIAGAHIGTGIKVDAGDINNGTFSLDGVKLECYEWACDEFGQGLDRAIPENNAKYKRTVILDVKGYCTVMDVRNLNSGTLGIGETSTPLFKIGTAAAVKIQSSTILSKKIAELTSYPAPTTPKFEGVGAPTWLSFDNCRFGYSDPRWDTSVITDGNSGYDLLNCRDERGMMPYFRKEPANISPMIPYKVKAEAGEAGQIKVTWATSAGATSYIIERRTNVTGFTKVGTAEKDVTTYTDTGLAAGTNYYYQIRAVAGNVISWPSIENAQATAK